MNTGSKSTEQPSVFLLGASFNTGNRGVAALASGSVNSILSGIPNARVYLLDYGKTAATYTVRHSAGSSEVELVNLRFSKKFWLKNNIAWLLLIAFFLRIIPSASVRQKVIDRNPVLKKLSRATVVASIAGGDSFSDIYGMVRLLYVALPQLLVLMLGKSLMLLPQTLGPFKSSIAKGIAGFIMRHARVVYARDQESLREAADLVGTDANRYRFSYDMAFAMPPFPPAKQRFPALRERSKGPVVGLNVSGLLYMGGYNRSNMFGLKENYQELIHEVIRFFIAQGANVVLIPHVFGDDEESDVVALRPLFALLESEGKGRLHIVEGDFDQHEIKYIIGHCDFFLGARMHACIAALSQGVPAVGMAYSKKFSGVFRSVGVEDLVVDLRSLSSKDVMDSIGRVYHDRAAIRTRLAGAMPGIQRTVLALFQSSEPPNSSQTPETQRVDTPALSASASA